MGWPAYLEENFITDLKLSTKIVPKNSRPYCFFCRNLFPLDPVEDKLIKDPSQVESLHLGSTSPAPFCNPTPGPALVFAPVLAPVPTPAPAPIATNDLFQEFIKAFLKSNQRPKQLSAERKQLLKARVLKLYYGKSYIDSYHFYQQNEDHFETAEASGGNRTPFAAFFLRDNINMR